MGRADATRTAHQPRPPPVGWPMTQFGGAGGSFGPNAWLVDDMYDRFLADPGSVAESWREFFADYRPAPVPAPAVARVGTEAPAAAVPTAGAPATERIPAEAPSAPPVVPVRSAAAAP